MHRLKMYKRGRELVRNLYESWLLLTVCLLLQWNQWHLLIILKIGTNECLNLFEMVNKLTFTWSSVFFNIGLLLAIQQFRPQWIKCYGHQTRLLLLPIEVVMLIYLTEWMELQMWEPFLGIIEQLLHALADARRVATLYYYWPSLSAWLIHDAYHVVRFFASFSFFLVAIDAAAPNWHNGIDFLILGRLPETPEIQRLIRRAQQMRKHAHQHKNHPIDLTIQELLSWRMCDVYIQRFY